MDFLGPASAHDRTNIGRRSTANLIGKTAIFAGWVNSQFAGNAVVCRNLAHSSKWGRSNSRRLCFCFVSVWNFGLPHEACDDVVRSDSSTIGLGNTAARGLSRPAVVSQKYLSWSMAGRGDSASVDVGVALVDRPAVPWRERCELNVPLRVRF